jgi:hypothetical protein
MRVCLPVRSFGATSRFDAALGAMRRVVALGLLGIVAGVPAMGAVVAKNAEAPIRIPLESLGYQPLLGDLMAAGSPMLTVNFVDKDHLLVTFEVRRLMKREIDPPPGDDDRMIGGYLVELPAGKVLAQTEWRMHDRQQYLWPLGDGRFLLRVRDSLTLLAPREAANPEAALDGTPILQSGRHIVAILVSPDKRILTLETTARTAREGEAADENGAPLDPTNRSPVQINFYRLHSSDDSPGQLVIAAAGAIRARSTIALPMTTAGFLDVEQDGKDAWLFDFDEHAGKVDPLAEWETSCFPRATFVGPSEFVAFGCRGSEDKPEFAAFNLKGELEWQQTFYDSYVAPVFSFAPAAGRFALGRMLTAGSLDASIALSSAAVTGQDVRVYQSYSGKQIFRIDCTPVERSGENFALSEDGLRLAVIRQMTVHRPATKEDEAYTYQSTGVEVYTLPPLTDKDEAEVAKGRSAAPADVGARLDDSLARLVTKQAAAEAKADGASASPALPAAAAMAASAPAAEGESTPPAVSAQASDAVRA